MTSTPDASPERPFQYDPAAPPAPRTPKVDGLAIAALVLGIVWIWWIGSVLAIIFGIIAIKRISKSEGWRTGKGMAIAGLVLGLVGVAVLAIGVVLAVAVKDDTSASGGIAQATTVLDSINNVRGEGDGDTIPIMPTFQAAWDAQTEDQQIQACATILVTDLQTMQAFQAEGIYNTDEVWDVYVRECVNS
jgi:hypothetical protein